MPARLGYGLIYACIRDRLDEDGRLKLDALLGDPAAVAEVAKRRRDAVNTGGFEVG